MAMASLGNLYNISSVLSLQGLELPREASIPALLFAMLSYMIIIFCNLVLLITIILNKSLHQPMYLLLLNLPINDLVGSTALLPQMIKELMWDTRTMEFSTCVAQAFFIHVYGVGAVLILSAMAYDRYMAICVPLRYNTVMTHSHIMKLVSVVWIFNFILIAILFYLLLRLPRCKSHMTHLYCDNPSLLQLVCVDTTVNNIYGLLITAITQIIGVGLILFTYLQILFACLRNKRSDTRSKALQTCGAHLIVFLILECLGLFTIISYRLKELSSSSRRFIGVTTLIFPPTLNPIIYGLKTKEIRTSIIKLFRQKVFPF
ncbi:olfactory receptor 52B2-like [Pangasianodon hypophthalmus]|uniref:olfactory receptor 52B2-like n=1 Tax=Pangasianodon hypophthalmus TaxID=310915 RepID=UPI000F004069|nr:olfactory receptor 52B2-like [Pangasianodon hypophthalmus]